MCMPIFFFYRLFSVYSRELMKLIDYSKLRHGMRFPTMWYVGPTKPEIGLHIRAVWSEPLLVTCIFYECLDTDWTTFGDSKIKMRLHRLVWVYTCQNTTLLVITCCGSVITVNPVELRCEKYSKISNTFLCLFLNKILVIRAGIHKMFVSVANREDLDQTASWSALFV